MTGASDIDRDALQAGLESIIDRMQFIQRELKASGQPPGMGELAELKKLGREYARIIEQLANEPGSTGLV